MNRDLKSILGAAILAAATVIAPSIRAADAVISEFMASNLLTSDDRERDSSDWIEIHNVSGAALDLSGWFLTDDPRRLRKWPFPEGVSLEADDYLLVFASGKDRLVAGRELHANFGLSDSGEYLALVAADGETVVHEYAPAFPLQLTDVSYGLASGSQEPGYLAEPTPGGPNGDLGRPGPVVVETAHAPDSPTESESLVVTATVRALLAPVAGVELTYRILYGDEVGPLPMVDDGTGGDATRGDGIFTAVIPDSAYSAGAMVRWYVTTTDAAGGAARSPAFLDARESPEYHGTVIADPSIESDLPVLHWFLAPGTESRADTRSGTRAALFFRGELYDNVLSRVRGGSTTNLQKKSYKFDLNPGHHFRFDPDAGRAEEFNLNTTYTDKSFARQALAYEMYDGAGAPGSESFNVRVQRGGGFFSVAAFIEQPDDDLLEREGLDDRGALYKMFNTFTSASSGVEKKNRRHENSRDLTDFVGGISSSSGDALKAFIFDNVDLPRVLSYLAANALTQNNDSMAKNYYLYRDSDGSGEWLILPWDLDLTFGRHFMTDDNILGDTIWADEDHVLGGRGRNVPISPSHPFMGMQSLPGNRSWNRLIDKLFRVPEFADMFRRRLRTLMDELLQGADTPLEERVLEMRLDEMAARMARDVDLDIARWSQYGQRQTLEQAMDVLKHSYLEVRRGHLFETHLADNEAEYPEPRAFSAALPRAQSPAPEPAFGEFEYNPASGNQDEEFIEIVNPGAEAIDLSGWLLTGGVEHTFKPGTVILGESAIYVTPSARAFRAREASPTGGESRLVQGDYSGHLSSFGEKVCLESPEGREVDCLEFEGSPSAAQRYLRITELHYHPLGPSDAERAAGFADQDDFEFIELFNSSGTETLDLDGVRFTGGVAFDFSGRRVTSLAPLQTVLVVSHLAAFERRYGGGRRIAGEYGPSRLDNDGESVKLEDAANGTIQEFTYNDSPAGGWPAEADGAGSSLEALDLEGDYDEGANWRASSALHGTPGSLDGVVDTPMFIRGDVDLDRSVDVADAVRILLHLFSGEAIGCGDAADADDSETLDVTDAVRVLDYLFARGPAPEAPFPAAGPDPSGTGLDCQRGL